MSAKHTPATDKLRLQALWDAHRELNSMRRRLSALGCDATVAKIDAAQRSVAAAYAAANKRLDVAIERKAQPADPHADGCPDSPGLCECFSRGRATPGGAG